MVHLGVRVKVKIGGPFKVTDPMKDNIHKVLNHNGVANWGRLSPGTFVKEFEDKFAAYHGVKHAIMIKNFMNIILHRVSHLEWAADFYFHPNPQMYHKR